MWFQDTGKTLQFTYSCLKTYVYPCDTLVRSSAIVNYKQLLSCRSPQNRKKNAYIRFVTTKSWLTRESLKSWFLLHVYTWNQYIHHFIHLFIANKIYKTQIHQTQMKKKRSYERTIIKESHWSLPEEERETREVIESHWSVPELKSKQTTKLKLTYYSIWGNSLIGAPGLDHVNCSPSLYLSL